MAGGAPDVFAVSGGYAVSNTVVDGATLDVSGTGRAQFTDSLVAMNGGMVLLGRAAASARDLTQEGALLSGSGILRVSGTAQLSAAVQSGAGTTTLSGASTIGGTVQLDGGRTLENDGTLVWNGGSIALGSGDAAASMHAGTLTNAAGGLLQIAGAGTIASPGGGAVRNAGTLLKSGSGAAVIAADLANDGTILVQGGSLALAGAVGGTGLFEIDGGRLDFFSALGGGEAIRFLGGGGTLAVEQAGVFAAPVSGFIAGDVLDLTALGFAGGPKLGFVSNAAGGTLTVNDGTHSVMIGLLGSYAPAGFQLMADGHGGVSVAYG